MQLVPIIGRILWGHSGPLCHAFVIVVVVIVVVDIDATVAACNSSNTWWMAVRRVAARSGECAQHFSNASRY